VWSPKERPHDFSSVSSSLCSDVEIGGLSLDFPPFRNKLTEWGPVRVSKAILSSEHNILNTNSPHFSHLGQVRCWFSSLAFCPVLGSPGDWGGGTHATGLPVIRTHTLVSPAMGKGIFPQNGLERPCGVLGQHVLCTGFWG
jgi:hypothetical protein